MAVNMVKVKVRTDIKVIFSFKMNNMVKGVQMPQARFRTGSYPNQYLC